MLDALTKAGVLAFSDPAGAKACLATAAILRARNPDAPLQLFSNKHYDFYAAWHTPVTVAESVDISALPQRPDWVFTGTSHPDTSQRFELRAIEQARQVGIPSYAFVDHWTNMRLRFTEADGRLTLPDTIGVLDDQAREAAIADGLPADRLELCPNPYLTYIAKLWEPAHSREDILQSLPRGASRYILYVPDPISLRNNAGAWGFNEISALQDLTVSMSALPADVALLVKAHPLQPMEAFGRAMEEAQKGSHAILPAPAFDNLGLAAGAEAVVGFHSNFLIEADALGAHVLRYFPSTPEQDALAHLRLGKKLHSLRDLTAALQNILT